MKVLRNEGEAKWEYVKSKLAENIKRFRRANRMEELWINVEPVWEKKTEVVDMVGETDEDDDGGVLAVGAPPACRRDGADNWGWL